MATFYLDMLELIHIVHHLDPKASSLLCYQEYEKGIRPLLLIFERCVCLLPRLLPNCGNSCESVRGSSRLLCQPPFKHQGRY